MIMSSDVYQTQEKIMKSGKKKPVQIVYNLMPSPVSLQVRPHCKFFLILKWADITGCDGSLGPFHKSHQSCHEYSCLCSFSALRRILH